VGARSEMGLGAEMRSTATERWGVGGVAALVLVLASCGLATQTPTASPKTHPANTGTPAPTATPSPTASQPTGPLAACLTAPSGGTLAPWGFGVTKGSQVEVLSTNGTVLNTAAAATYPITVPVPVGAGQAGVYLYDESSGELTVLGKSGAAQDLGTITPTGGWNGADTISLAESPNGQCWVFVVNSYDTNQVATSQIYAGGTGVAPTLVTTLTRSNTAGGGYQALRWDVSGVLLGTYPTGVGGAGPFIGEGYSLSTVVRMDPQTGALSPPLCSSGRFADKAADGTLACLTGVGTDTKILVTTSGGSTTTIDTGSDTAGLVSFVGGSSVLTYCTSAAASSGWTEALLSVALGGSSPSPTTLIPASAGDEFDGSLAWFRLVGTTSIAEILGGSGPTSLAEVNLSTGQQTTIAPADSLLGVL
jgi:hypothetical protein